MARTTRIVSFFSIAFTVLVLLCLPLIGEAEASCELLAQACR